MKILFGVFDWGLGHATRDTPLISELVKKHEVHVISTGRALKILQDNFKNKCRYYDIPSLYPIYTKTKTNIFQIDFALAIPSIIKSLKYAREKSKEIIDNGFDIVISDCRYDVYDSPKNSYLINHQLRFKTLFGFERLAERWLAKRMEKYRCVLVPDFPKKNLTGRLSHELKYFPKNKVKYMGILSHIKKSNLKQDIEYFFSLSGPEQTRIKLEKNILSQINQIKGKIAIAGGNPDIESKNISKNIEFHSFLNKNEQENFMNRAKFLIIRSGYTTLMETVELDKKALLIPSPGQTEQEYLADYYEKQGYFHHVHQDKLNLKEDIEISSKFKGFKAPWKTQESIKKFIKIINA